MNKARKMCFDKILPKDLLRQKTTTIVLPNGQIVTKGPREAALAAAGKRWISGIT